MGVESELVGEGGLEYNLLMSFDLTTFNLLSPFKDTQ